jgi:hypothetical protein
MISPGLAYSQTAIRNSLGCRVRVPLVMCASAPAEIQFAGVDRFITANPCQVANRRPGVAVTQWQIKPRTGEFNLEIFQEM